MKGEKEGKAEEAREMGTVKARKPIMVRLPSGIEVSPQILTLFIPQSSDTRLAIR